MIIILILIVLCAIVSGAIFGAVGMLVFASKNPDRAGQFAGWVEGHLDRRQQAGVERAHPEYHLNCGHAPGDHDIQQAPQSYAEWQAKQPRDNANPWS
jgi:hypothetical protein